MLVVVTRARAPAVSLCGRIHHLPMLVHVGMVTETQRGLRRLFQRVGLGLQRLPLSQQEARLAQHPNRPRGLQPSATAPNLHLAAPASC